MWLPREQSCQLRAQQIMQCRPQQNGSLGLHVGRHTDPHEPRAPRQTPPPRATDHHPHEADRRQERDEHRPEVLGAQERVLSEAR